MGGTTVMGLDRTVLAQKGGVGVIVGTRSTSAPMPRCQGATALVSALVHAGHCSHSAF